MAVAKFSVNFFFAASREESQHPARQTQPHREYRQRDHQRRLVGEKRYGSGETAGDAANDPEGLRAGLGKAGLFQPAAHGGPFLLGGTVFLHVLEHDRDILALLGGLLGRIAATAAGAACRLGHRGDALLGRIVAAGKSEPHAAKREHQQETDRKDHWLTLSRASASSFSRL